MALLVNNWRITNGTLRGSIAGAPEDIAGNVTNVITATLTGRKGLSTVIGDDGQEYFLTHTPDRDAVLATLPPFQPDIT